MVERISRTPEAFEKRLQMFRGDVAAFVESSEDRPFYSRILDSVCANRGVEFTIFSGEEIKGGGKNTLLGLFRQIQDSGLLSARPDGTAQAKLFFLHKDVDDFLEITVESDYIIYTEGYEMENYLFMYGDIINSSFIAGKLDMQSVKEIIGEPREWRRRVARELKHWAILCFLAKVKFNSNSAFYSCNVSRVHSFEKGNCRFLENEFLALKESIRQESQLSDDSFEQSFGECLAAVNEIYDNGQHDRIIKGKWYKQFLVSDTIRALGDGAKTPPGLDNVIISTLCATLDMKSDWFKRYEHAILKILPTALVKESIPEL